MDVTHKPYDDLLINKLKIMYKLEAYQLKILEPV